MGYLIKIHKGNIKRYEIREEELYNLRVEVYRNLHKNMWSIKALNGKHKGKVILNTPEIVLTNCEFVVSKKGREWVMKNKVKKVHAVVRGYLLELLLSKNDKTNIKEEFEIYYNPYTTDEFIMKISKKELKKENIKVIFTDENKLYKVI